MKDMSCRVVQSGLLAIFLIDFQMHFITELNAASLYLAPMYCEVRRWMLGIHHLYDIASRAGNGTPVTNLTAGFSIERRHSREEINHIAFPSFRSTCSVSI